MKAQIILVARNGYAEARDPKLRDRHEMITILNESEIKDTILSNLLRVGREGHVVAKWNNKLFVCEMKQNRRNYTRVEVEYHPFMEKFEI
jgi:hypothetical protein